RMKRSFAGPRTATCARRRAFTCSERPLPASASELQTPRYSTRSQWSTRLAVPVSASRLSTEISEQNGLLRSGVTFSFGDHDADDLTRLDGLAGSDRKARDVAVAVRVHLVLHLHRLDDAENLSGSDGLALLHLDGEHR